ncbi:hypothetical protein B0A50_03218 [Salinomyces thailandicus]|uniref:Uncharacterized protein n=1 Tax=Salinomyces thailandicus TaxID=706561 RepID=A0A4U0U4Q8_9PEZI|nr:hypothetical protein B0A50_03218 [Salinomyces thailandica]
MEARALTPEAARVKRRIENDISRRYHMILRAAALGLPITATPERCAEFLNELDLLANRHTRKLVVDLAEFNDLTRGFGLDDDDQWCLSMMLLRAPIDADRLLGKKLLFTSSANGHEEATIRILNHALLGNKAQPGLLRSNEILQARGQLRKIARSGESYRAAVLEGKIAYQLGDDAYAIQMLTQAMDAAVAAAQEQAKLRSQGLSGRLKELRQAKRRDLTELSSPWIELTLVHFERYGSYYQRKEFAMAFAELEKARKANEIGCAQDDPTSHYQAAEFFKDYNDDGTFKYTSRWLYHMSKAAASSHVKAAHALAEFYSSSGWKYVEDEPPDDVKPTPFDSYPASADSTTSGPSITWRKFLGLSSPPNPETVRAGEMFQMAAFPWTPTGRWLLAFNWLESSLEYLYAPSYLLATKMLLEKDLWGLAHAPEPAMALSETRYRYASRDDYETGRPLEGAAEEVVTPDEKNPSYNPEQAKFYLTEVFYAVEATRLYAEMQEKARQKVRKGILTSMDAENISDATAWGEFAPKYYQKWLWYPDIHDMWAGEVNNLEREAIAICEQQNWDIYDADGGLVHRAGLGNRGRNT